MVKDELLWWVNNLELCNGQLFMQPQVQVLIQTDTSNKGWGSCMSRNLNRGQEGTGSTYQSAWIFSGKVYHFDICQNVGNGSLTCPGRKHDSFELLAENGRYKESRTNANLKGNLGVSTWAGFTAQVNRSRLLPNIYQRTTMQCRLRISAPERFLGMETVRSNFQQNMPNIGKKPEIDLIASRSSNQLPSYYS